MDLLPATSPARADALRKLGFPDPSEADGVAEVVAAFCGAGADLAVLEAPAPQPEPWAQAGRQGRWLRDAGGLAWGLLRVDGHLGPRRRAGLERAAGLLEARARMRRERRGTSRGPEGASFVPGLVHELRNAAFGFSAVLDAFQARYGDREEARRYGGALRVNLERLTGFLDELGLYGEPGAAPREPLPLARVLEEAVATCRALEAGRDLRLVWEGPPVRVLGDGPGLREAFVSLLRWALGQGAGAGQAVVLAAGPGASGHVDGPGLASGLDPGRIFEPFYFRVAGMGRLALPVARRILEAHGGTLGAVSGPGGALRIAFSLPGL